MIKKKDKTMEDTPHHGAKESSSKSKYIDIHSTDSDLTGLAGLFEEFLRKYKGSAQVFAIIPALFAYVLSVSISLTPGFLIVTSVFDKTATLAGILHAFLVCIAIVISYGIYGVLLILIVPVFNKMIPFRVRSWRGNWYSIQSIPWFYHNALTQLVRYTFLDFVTPTPLNLLFYKLMGMKIGKNCVINTSNISDPCLIELEDNVTIGGSATIFGHYAQGGILVLAPVKIKRGATIGLKASIMGDVIVGEKVTVKPHSILLPKTRLNKGDPQ